MMDSLKNSQVSSSSSPEKKKKRKRRCRQCDRYEKELQSKDELILGLTEKLETINNISNVQAEYVPLQKRKFSIAKVNVEIDGSGSSSSSKICVGRIPSSSGATDKSDSTLKVQVCQLGSARSHERNSFITVQEIIDKVVERSPILEGEVGRKPRK